MTDHVTAQPSGHAFEVLSEESILEAALNHGFNFPYGCRNGFCGACRAQVTEGAVAYPKDYDPRDVLADDEIEKGTVLCCQARPVGAIQLKVEEIETASEIEPKIYPCKVDHIDRLAPDVIRLYLKLPEADRMPFLAGQYIEILTQGKRRAFSMGNAPHDDARIELHIRHVEGGTFTDYAFNAMHEKDILRFEGPLGNFYLREGSDRPMVMVAGGTGFAPIKSIVEHAIAEKLEREIHVYWGVRDVVDLYLKDLGETWAAQHSNVKFIPVLSDAQGEWNGRSGYVHSAVLADFPDMSGVDVYMAGPPVMIDACRSGFLAAGLPDDRIYSDSFEIAGEKEKKDAAA